MPDSPPYEALILGSSGEFTPVITLASTFPHPLERNGKKCSYFWKESLGIGRYRDATGRQFEVTPDRVDRIITNFNKAKANVGFEPSLPQSHNVTAGKNYGYVVDARANAKGNLELLHQFLGEAERDEALNKKTSVCLLPNFTDEKGNTYDEILDHNAIIPNPQLNFLEDFKPALAASRGQPLRAVSLSLSAIGDYMATPEVLEYVRRECSEGKGDDVTPDNAVEKLIASHRSLKQAHGGLKLSRDETDAKLTEANAKLTEATAKLAAAEGKALELSRSAPKSLDPELAHERRIRLQERREKLVDRGFSPATADKIMEKVLGSETKPNVFALSRGDDAKDVWGAEFLDILADATLAPKTGTTTTAQVLGRELPHAPPAPAAPKNELVEMATSMGYADPAKK